MQLYFISFANSLAMTLQALTATFVTAPTNERWQPPVSDHAIVTSFEPHDTYGPGHRGVDFQATANQKVTAVAPGRVVWAGKVAGRYTISIDHGSEKSTYEPVSPEVKVGEAVSAGDTIGRITAGKNHCAETCLHLGRIRGNTYLDPEERLGTSSGYRLISPVGDPPKPPMAQLGESGIPVVGVVTSRFGMRIHPITKEYRFHDGIDIAAPCGKPVRSMGAGTVTFVGTRSGYGRQIEITHAGQIQTSYAHLSKSKIRVGDKVKRGQEIGTVGQTGRATGCHVHVMKIKQGKAVDPQRK